MARRATDDRERQFTLVLSIGFFILACATPALKMRSYSEYPLPGVDQPQIYTSIGLRWLVVGWTLLSVPLLAWLANVTLALGWLAILKRWWLAALALAIASLFLAADLLRFIPGGTGPLGIYRQSYYFIDRPLIGCICWLASMATLAIGAAFSWRRSFSLRKAIAFGAMLILLVGGAFGWYRSLRPFDRWIAQTNEIMLQRRVDVDQPIGGTEEETLAFLRDLGIADENLRLIIFLGRLERINGWFPQPQHPFASRSYPLRIEVECIFTDARRLRECRVYGSSYGDPDTPQNPSYVVQRPDSRP